MMVAVSTDRTRAMAASMMETRQMSAKKSATPR
jgi:hypothetical protein